MRIIKNALMTAGCDIQQRAQARWRPISPIASCATLAKRRCERREAEFPVLCHGAEDQGVNYVSALIVLKASSHYVANAWYSSKYRLRSPCLSRGNRAMVQALGPVVYASHECIRRRSKPRPSGGGPKLHAPTLQAQGECRFCKMS